ncbi:MAG: hypothetical protein ACFFG0_00405 [Candidatus Thorarchaeota archaeon]
MIRDLFKKIREEKSRECKGCSSFASTSLGFIKCLLPPVYSEIKKCPCKECLVKVTCFDPCRLFGDYRESIPGRHKEALGVLYKGIFYE